MGQVTWEITGRLTVEEDEINGSGLPMIRVLAGVEVEVSASNFGTYSSWGKVHTNADGYFTLRNVKDESKRKIKVKVRFADSTLEINTGLLANPADFISPAIEVFEHSQEVEGPHINIGTRCFKSGGAGELGNLDNRRRAIAWYFTKTLMNALTDHDPYFAFKSKIKVIYPANVVSGQCYANGLTRSVYIHSTDKSDQWSVPTLAHELSHIIYYDHNYGTANWFAAVFCPPDMSTHSQSERPQIAMAEGFAEFAAWEWLRELWGHEAGSTREKKLPYTRYALVHSLHLNTIDEVEQSDVGVERALRLLTARAFYARKFGDKHTQLESNPYPLKVSTPFVDCPPHPKVTIWDVLKVFQANPGAGWPTEWQVGSSDYGIRRFFERAADVLDNLDEQTKNLMLDLIDPNGIKEPSSRCTKNLTPVHGAGMSPAVGEPKP